MVWIQNGETYNHDEIRKGILKDWTITSHSDCAVTGPLYLENGRDFDGVCDAQDGMYAIAMYDEGTGKFYAARDEMGKASMYWGRRASDGSIWVASEMKALIATCDEIYLFPPGHYMTVDGMINGRPAPEVMKRWFNERWVVDPDYQPQQPADLVRLRELLVNAVVKRLMTDVPFGILLSGGLDSSLVAAIAVKHLKSATNSYNMGEKLKTFAIGLPGSPDLAAAQTVADMLGTDHTNFTFTVQEGIDCLDELVYHIESYEQVRAAVPMYLLSRRIKALGIKMVLSGEGSDELYGGYLYFHKAPSGEEFHRECVRKTTRLHQWDVLRANKAPFAFGVEPRTPFLDRDFMNFSMEIRGQDKMIDLTQKPDGKHPKGEKYLIRKAFDTPEDPYLPDSVLWRQKEQFSDGVGYSWVDGLKDYASSVVTDEQWAQRAERFPVDTPRTREYYLLRSIFEKHYPGKYALDTVPKGLSVACSSPEAVAWDPAWKDLHEISGRAIGVHDAAAGFRSMDEDSKRTKEATQVSKAVPVAMRAMDVVRAPRAAVRMTGPRRIGGVMMRKGGTVGALVVPPTTRVAMSSRVWLR